jgi:hypothetical protein
MGKIILIVLIFYSLISCGPSLEEKAYLKQKKLDSLELIKDKEISEPVNPKQKGYYLAIDFGLIQGEVFDFSPTDETIELMECAGGENQDMQIYIKIQEVSGKITVLPCDYKTWLNLPKGAILK